MINLKKQWISLFLSVALIFTLAGETFAAPAPACKVSGNGTAKSPYTLCTAKDFNLMRTYPSKYFQQGAHITLTNWVPIPSFTGSFNGKSYYLTLQSSEQGLFNDNYGMVSNIVMKADIRGTWQVAGIAKTNRGTLRNVIVTGYVSARWNAGGLVTYNYGTILEGRVSALVYGDSSGGIASMNYGKIEGSFVSGGVVGSYDVGGLVSQNYGMINNSHTWGKPVNASITGSAFATFNAESGRITNSSSTNDVYKTLHLESGHSNFVRKNNGKIINSKGTGRVVTIN